MRAIAVVVCLTAALVDAAPQEHFARLAWPQAGNVRVRYLAEGKGPVAVVLVHGWTCGAAFWRQQSADLSHLFRVISIDLPGHGKSDKPQKIEYTVPLFAAAIDAVMRDASVSKAVIAGHSMGVPVAAQAIEDHPERFLGFVAVDGAVWHFKGPRTQPSPYVLRLRRDFATAASRNIESMFSEATPEALRSEIRERMLATPAYVAASALDNLPKSDVWTRAPLKIPTLAIVAGSRREEDRRAIHEEYFPNLQFEAWEEAGHFLMMEQPARFNQLVMEFTQKLVAPSR